MFSFKGNVNVGCVDDDDERHRKYFVLRIGVKSHILVKTKSLNSIFRFKRLSSPYNRP
jgi:hypothetical protein